MRLENTLVQKVVSLWNQWIEPTRAVQDPERRRQARFLTSILLFLLLTTFALFVVRLPAIGFQANVEIVSRVVIALVMIPLYLLSRRGHVWLASLIAVVAGSLILFALALTDNPTQMGNTLGYLVVVLLFSGLFLPARLNILILSIQLLGMLIFGGVVSNLSLRDILTGPFSLNLTVGTIVILVAWHRNMLEQSHLAQLAWSEQRLRGVIANNVDGTVVVDQEGIIQFLNPAAVDLFAQPATQLLGQPFGRPITADQISEITLMHSHERRIVEMRQASIHWDNAPATLVSLHDVTTRQRAEEALRESEFFFKESQRAGFIGSYKTDFISGCWESSEVLDQIFGIDESYVRSVQGWLDIVHPNDQAMMAQYLREEVLSQHKPFNKEYRIIRKSDGETRWVLGLGKIACDAEGNVISLIGTIQDITARKRAEEQMELFKYSIDMAPDGAYWMDSVGHFRYVNDAGCKALGYTREEILHMQASDVNPRATPERYAQIWQAIKENQSVTSLSVHRRKDGSEFPVEITSTYVKFGDQEYCNGFVRDITERQRTEAELRQSEEQHRRLLNVLPSGVVIHTQGQIGFVNRVGTRLFGAKSSEQLLGTPLLERVHPDFRQVVQGRVRQSQETGAEAELIEEKLIRLDGNPFDAEVAAIAVQYSGRPSMLAVFNDITERKQRERELEAVVQMSTALRAARTRAEMLPIIARQVAEFAQVASVALLFYDDRANDYVIEYADGVWADMAGRRIPSDAGILRTVLAEGKPYVTNDLPNDPHFFYRDAIRDLCAFVEIPLFTHQTTIGFLAVASHTPFSVQDVQVLDAISNIAANAIHRAALNEEAQKYTVELAVAYQTTLEGWSHALELRDQETEGHTRRVVEITVKLARAMGMNDAEIEHLSRGALLHDIGKMGIPDSVLLKPGTLTEREWEIMRRHPEYAYKLLSPIDFLRPALDIPYCHHEKWDGTGYPRKLQGAAIPLGARIFAIVDVWDALCSDRPYRLAWPKEQAVAYIREQAGKHFDPVVVKAFLDMIEVE